MDGTNRTPCYGTNGTNSSVLYGGQADPEPNYIFAFIMLFLMVLILAGNSLTVYAIIRTPSLKTTSNAFVASLACADLLMGITIPFHVVLFIKTSLLRQQSICAFRYSSMGLSMGVSILNLVMLAIDRYIIILYPLHYHMILTPDTVKVSLFAVWTIGPLVSTSFNWMHSITWTGYCLYEHYVGQAFRIITTILYYVCMLVMMLLYIAVFRVVRRHLQFAETMRNSPNTSSFFSHIKHEAKAAKVLFLVFGLFVFCWTGFFSIQVVYDSNLMSVNTYKYVATAALLLGTCNSFINPIIYAWKNTGIRHAFICILGLKRFRKHNNSINHPEMSRIQTVSILS